MIPSPTIPTTTANAAIRVQFVFPLVSGVADGVDDFGFRGEEGGVFESFLGRPRPLFFSEGELEGASFPSGFPEGKWTTFEETSGCAETFSTVLVEATGGSTLSGFFSFSFSGVATFGFKLRRPRLQSLPRVVRSLHPLSVRTSRAKSRRRRPFGRNPSRTS